MKLSKVIVLSSCNQGGSIVADMQGEPYYDKIYEMKQYGWELKGVHSSCAMNEDCHVFVLTTLHFTRDAETTPD